MAHQSRGSKKFHNFLLVAGLALSKDDVQECMSMCETLKLITLVRPWIVQSLSQSAKFTDSADAMEAFWANGSYRPETIINVLECSTD